MFVYVKVTNDKYELPLAVADSERELARILHISVSAISHGVKKSRQGERSIYREVEIGEAVKASDRKTKPKKNAPKKAKPKKQPKILPERRLKKDE